MAQVVGFFENDTVYLEGPFVLGAPPIGSTMRIECESPGVRNSVMVHPTIYEMLDQERPGWRGNKAAAVDWLNAQTREQRIVLQELNGYKVYVRGPTEPSTEADAKQNSV